MREHHAVDFYCSNDVSFEVFQMLLLFAGAGLFEELEATFRRMSGASLAHRAW